MGLLSLIGSQETPGRSDVRYMAPLKGSFTEGINAVLRKVLIVQVESAAAVAAAADVRRARCTRGSVDL